jgi:hypothetical protein
MITKIVISDKDEREKAIFSFLMSGKKVWIEDVNTVCIDDDKPVERVIYVPYYPAYPSVPNVPFYTTSTTVLDPSTPFTYTGGNSE